MDVLTNIENINVSENTAICIGNFDGLHLGHRHIISTLKKEAENLGLKSVIMTFSPHPYRYFNIPIELISTAKKRLDKFHSQNVDYLVIANFNEELSSLSPEEFVANILVNKLKAKVVIVGNDYKFGYKKAGDTALLLKLGEKFGFKCIFLDKVKDNKGEIISSSRIRELIKKGDIELANIFLKEPYSLEGEVVHGDKKGRLLGYPTINLNVVNEVIPAYGVYSAKIKIKDEIHYGMAYIGMRPTINNDLELRIEANIFDFNQEVYGEYAEIILYKYIRGDIRFSSLDELIAQLGKDMEQVKGFFGLSGESSARSCHSE